MGDKPEIQTQSDREHLVSLARWWAQDPNLRSRTPGVSYLVDAVPLLVDALNAAEAKVPRYVAQCMWEIYRDGEFDGVCGNVRPCPKHDKPAAERKEKGAPDAG